MTTEANSSDSGHPAKTLAGLSVVLIPCLFAVFHGVADDTTPPLRVSRDRPSLTYASYLFHHGDEPIDSSGVLESWFRFRNDGEEPVLIGNVQRSCGCMDPQFSSMEIPPGESGWIKVPISTVNQPPGLQEYLLTVEYTDPKPRRDVLTIKAVFPEQQVRLMPRTLGLSQKTSLPLTHSVILADSRPEPLSVLRVTSSNDMVTGRAVPDRTDDGIPVTRIEVTVSGDFPAGRHQVLMHIHTDDEDHSILQLPILVSGPAENEDEGSIAADPDVLRIAIVSGIPTEQSVATGELTLPEQSDLSFVTAFPPQLQVDYEPISEPGESGRAGIAFTVRLTEPLPSELTEGVVTFSAGDGEFLETVRVMLVHSGS